MHPEGSWLSGVAQEHKRSGLLLVFRAAGPWFFLSVVQAGRQFGLRATERQVYLHSLANGGQTDGQSP